MSYSHIEVGGWCKIQPVSGGGEPFPCALSSRVKVGERYKIAYLEKHKGERSRRIYLETPGTGEWACVWGKFVRPCAEPKRA